MVERKPRAKVSPGVFFSGLLRQKVRSLNNTLIGKNKEMGRLIIKNYGSYVKLSILCCVRSSKHPHQTVGQQ